MTWLRRKYALFVFVLILMVSAYMNSSRADVGHFYLATSCDAKRGVAAITTTIVYNDDPAPPNMIHFGEVHSALLISPKRIKVCDLGDQRNVSLDIEMDEDHPRDDNIRVYIGTRPGIPVFDIPNTITITSLPTNFFVLIKKCTPLMVCSEFKYTNPSFDCEKAREKIERMVCRSDKLSELDVSLENAWRDALGKFPVNGKQRDRLRSDEILWIKSRRRVCNISDSLNPSISPMAAESCLEKLYENRIRELRNST